MFEASRFNCRFAYRPSGLWTGLFDSWCDHIFSEKKVDIHVKISQGCRLMEVSPCEWRPLSRNILRQSGKEVIADMNFPPKTYSEWSGPVVQNWIGVSSCKRVEMSFGGGRGSLGHATCIRAALRLAFLEQCTSHRPLAIFLHEQALPGLSEDRAATL